jgi:ribose transport system ATP-binding protein
VRGGHDRTQEEILSAMFGVRDGATFQTEENPA